MPRRRERRFPIVSQSDTVSDPNAYRFNDEQWIYREMAEEGETKPVESIMQLAGVRNRTEYHYLRCYKVGPHVIFIAVKATCPRIPQITNVVFRNLRICRWEFDLGTPMKDILGILDRESMWDANMTPSDDRMYKTGDQIALRPSGYGKNGSWYTTDRWPKLLASLNEKDEAKAKEATEIKDETIEANGPEHGKDDGTVESKPNNDEGIA